MSANSWFFIAIIGFLVFCCLPMLFMGRRGKSSGADPKRDVDRKPGE